MTRTRAQKTPFTRSPEACTTCQRRKEKCDGKQPCGRCNLRGVGLGCMYSQRRKAYRRAGSQPNASSRSSGEPECHLSDTQDAFPFEDPIFQASGRGHEDAGSCTKELHTSPIHEQARHIEDLNGTLIFIGDSANLSLLQTVRQLVRVSIGPCAFSDDPLQNQMVEPAPEGPASWLKAANVQCPTKPSLEQAQYLIRRFYLATNCLMDLFDLEDLMRALPSWLNSLSEEKPAQSALYFLIFAIGAQTAPEDNDALANTFLDHGRYLTASFFTENPSVCTIQAYSLITMFMLNACRRNAAFMYLGIAVRAAYALGLHSSDVVTLLTTAEIRTRERLWKAVRILDLFMSASLGRPPATTETRDTEQITPYSASSDLCIIFEKILLDVYAKRTVSTETVNQIGQHHRRWTLRFREGLDADSIKDEELVDGHIPNLGLIHVKEAYYWTIILLTRHFFVDHISTRLRSPVSDNAPKAFESSQEVLVHACLDSAVRTVDLIEPITRSEHSPKRLPFVVNSTFVAGLVLGLAYFGDFHEAYPLDDKFQMVIRILTFFPHDAVASRNLVIMKLLGEAANEHMKMQTEKTKKERAGVMRGLFGWLNDDNVARVVSPPDTVTAEAAGHEHLAASQMTPDEQVFGGRYHHDPPANGASLAEYDKTMQSSALPSLTLWFDSLEDNAPLFSVIRDHR